MSSAETLDSSLGTALTGVPEAFEEEAHALAGLAAFYASMASVLEGEARREALERFYDVLALVADRIPGSYREGLAEAAAGKAWDATRIVELYGEDYLEEVIAYLASDHCEHSTVMMILGDVVDSMGFSSESASRLVEAASTGSCEDAKLATLLALIVPPAAEAR